MPDAVTIESSSGGRAIAAVPTSTAAFVGAFRRGPVNDARRLRSTAEFEQLFGGFFADSPASYAVNQFFLNGGVEAWLVRCAPGSQAVADALPALDAVDVINLLCVPDTDQMPDADAAAVMTAAMAYAIRRRAMYLLDIPMASAPRTDVPAVHAWLQANAVVRHPNVAAFFPRPLVGDPASSFAPRAIPPSGTIAGLYARVDSRRGVWRAPAGTDAVLRGLQRFERDMDDTENRALNSIGVNGLRTFEGAGHVCWGARTLVGADALASQWKYIPVRRMALFLEESIARGTAFAASERNDEALWSEIRRIVGTFLHLLYIQGAFQGRTPSEGFFVKCDRSTMTQHDIDSGRVSIVVGFAAVKPAEFVFIKISQMTKSE